MVRIALTGGIASGKSLVSEELRRLGAVIIDADLIAREVVEPGTLGLTRVVERFGPGMRRSDGSLDRAALGNLIFADDAAREDLNAIVHPLVRARARELEARAPGGAVVVHVIPLLVETGQAADYDGVVVVDVPTETQVSRLMHRNDLTTVEARARIRSQATRPERRAAATWLVDNSEDVASTVARIRELWEGPITGLREAGEHRAAFVGLPSRVRGPERTRDVEALRNFIRARQHAEEDQEPFDLSELDALVSGARVLTTRGAIVGAVVVDGREVPPLVHGPWVVPGLRETGTAVLRDAAANQGR